MKKTVLQTIIFVIAGALVIALVLSATSAANSQRIFSREVEEKMLYATGKFANTFDLVLRSQEDTVDSLTALISIKFKAERCKSDRLLFESLKSELDDIVKTTLLQMNDVQGLYVTFNPNMSMGRDEIWYVKSEDGEAIHMDSEEMNGTWLSPDNEWVSYYYNALRSGSAWSTPVFDLMLKEEVISYSRAAYDRDGRLIGVVGADISGGAIIDTVENMKIYNDSKAFLLDGDLQYIAGEISGEEFSSPDYDDLNSQLSASQEREGALFYRQDGTEYIGAYSYLSNGWILAIIQPKKIALAPIENTKNMILLITILTIAAFASFTVYYLRRLFQPVIKEIEQKDILLIYKSRQAKLGEMIGNIAHQWKQPLNGMSITLSNMEDDYRHQELAPGIFDNYINKMRLSIRTMSDTADDFAGFLKPDREREVFSIRESIKEALGFMNESIKVNSILVEIEAEEDLKTNGFKNEFIQGLFNILFNARDAIISSDPPERIIRIRIVRSGAAGAPIGNAEIDIFNTGDPILPDILKQMFTPYFTTKDQSGGTGIGLYLTRQIVEEHMKGSIKYVNQPEGVCCRIILPVAE